MIKYIATILCTTNCTAVELDISQAISDAEVQNLMIPEEHDYRVPTLNHYG